MSDCAPVILFIYNRPEHTARMLAALAANPLAADSDLIIYADGPKKSEHRQSVVAARAVARQASGFKSVRLIERHNNLGLANSIIAGVTEVCETHGRAIVVEDDLVVAPAFLAFLNAALDCYADEARVLQVSGYSYPVDGVGVPLAYFLPMVSCWGWATWARAWKMFDPSMAALAQLDSDAVARRQFNIDDAYDYYGMACDQRSGRIDSWGVRWQLSLFANGGLVLYPLSSLVYNAGVDASGTHGAGHAAFQSVDAVHASASIGEWPAPFASARALEQVKRLLGASRPSLVRRAIERIRR